MKSGGKQVDKLLEVWVAPEDKDVPALRQLVGVYAGKLGQESMYFERTGSTVEFVPPLPAKEVKP